ncbi:MAG: hypothetical protein ACXQS4_02435 [Methermicoccaceae archaeon]
MPITTPRTISEPDSDATSQEGIITFLYPLVPEEKYVVDGVADGNVVISGSEATASYPDLDELNVILQKITDEGVATDLATYTLGARIAAGGGDGVIVDGSDEGADWTYAFPFWLEPSAQEVSSDERLRLKIVVWARRGAGTGGTKSIISLVATKNSDDLYVNLPIV